MTTTKSFGYYTDSNSAKIELGGGTSGKTYHGWIAKRSPNGEYYPNNPEANRVDAALKQVRRDGGDGYLLKREVILLARIGERSHPHLVSYLRLLYDGSIPVIATEYVPGETLQQEIDRHNQEGSLQTPERVRQVMEWGTQVASALEFLQGLGITHRDIKPSNIVIRADKQWAVLIDFGVGRSDIFDSLGNLETQTLFQFVGTPAYASPELFQAAEANPAQPATPLANRSPKVDIYALGATLWCALQGKPIFDETGDTGTGRATLARLKREGPPTTGPLSEESTVPLVGEIRALLCRMLAAEPESRPAASQVKEELLHILKLGYGASGMTALPQTVPPPPRHRMLQCLPNFVSLGKGVEIAETLLPNSGLSYWTPMHEVQVDLDSSASKPAHVAYEVAETLLEALNNDVEVKVGPWYYRMPTKDEWMIATGFSHNGDKIAERQLYRPRVSDLREEYEWCDVGQDAPEYIECRPLCRMDGTMASKVIRHTRWPKGALRLVRTPRVSASAEAS